MRGGVRPRDLTDIPIHPPLGEHADDGPDLELRRKHEGGGGERVSGGGIGAPRR
jgi:hypothetical protein